MPLIRPLRLIACTCTLALASLSAAATAAEPPRGAAAELLSRMAVTSVRAGARTRLPESAHACLQAIPDTLVVDAMAARLVGAFSPEEIAELDRMLGGPAGEYLTMRSSSRDDRSPIAPTPKQIEAMAAFNASPLSERLMPLVMPQPAPHAEGSVESLLIAAMDRCEQGG